MNNRFIWFGALRDYWRSEETKANLVPFAVISAGYIAPSIIFLAAVCGLVASGGDSAPHLVPFLVACAASVAAWWLPAGWYHIREFERDGRVYEYMGVRLFRRVVPNGDWVNAWRRRRDPSFRVVSSYGTAMRQYRRAVLGERNHLVLFVLTGAAAVYAWRIGWDGWARYLAVANVLVNVYPILLQRYTRARIYRIATRGGSERAVQCTAVLTSR